MVAAASLLINIAADIAGLKKGMGEATQSINRFGSTLKTGLAGIGIGLSLEGIRQLIDSVGALGEQAESVNLDVETFQAFSAAMREAGVAAEQTTAILGRAGTTLGKAFQGNKETIESLRRLGVNLIDARGNALSYEEALPELAQAILAIENPLQRAAAAAEFFGLKGRAMLPALESIAKGGLELRQQFAGEIISAEAVKRFDELSDALTRIGKIQFAQLVEFINDVFDPVTVGEIEKTADAFNELFKAMDIDTSRQGLIDKLQKFIAATTRELTLLAHVLTVVVEGLKRFDEEFRNSLPTGKTAAAAAALAATPPPSPIDEGGRLRITRQLVTLPRTGRGGGLPSVVGGGGTDKFAEAIRKLKEDYDKATAASAAFAASLVGQTEAEKRAAQSYAEASGQLTTLVNKLREQGVAIGPQQAEELKKWIFATRDVTFALEERKRIQDIANEVNKTFGDGAKELATREADLKRAVDDGLISREAYTAAMKEATEAQEQQRLKVEGAKGGIDGLIAGWQSAQLRMGEGLETFAMGQELFNSSVNLMSDALTELASTGQINFQKLAQSFAQMIIQMTMRWLAFQAITGIAGLFGSGGTTPGGYPVYGPGSIYGPGSSPTGRASGGPVWPGQAYMVGERGPELFMPRAAGTIVPSAGGIVVNIANHAPAKVSARRDPNNPMRLDVLIEPIEAAIAGRMARGEGSLGRVIEGTYGAQRQSRA